MWLVQPSTRQALRGLLPTNGRVKRQLARLTDWTWRQMGGQGVWGNHVSPADDGQLAAAASRYRAHHPKLSVVDVLESMREPIKTGRPTTP